MIPFRRRRSAVPDSITFPPFWRRYGPKGLAAAIVVSGLVCARSATEPVQGNDRSRYHDRLFRVVHIVDGDTLDINAPDGLKAVTRIRLWGVDTPEIGRGGKPSMHFATEGKRFAERTLAGRSVQIVLSLKRTRGKYGRLLAYVFLRRDGRMFNEMLLEEGYAYADLRFDHHYFKRFKTIEKRARKADVGLWADVTLDRMPPWKQRFERRGAEPGG